MSETLLQAQRNKEETGEHHHASLGTAVMPSGTAVMSAGGCLGGGTHGR